MLSKLKKGQKFGQIVHFLQKTINNVNQKINKTYNTRMFRNAYSNLTIIFLYVHLKA